MSQVYVKIKKQLEKKYAERLPKSAVTELLTFESGLLENKFPQKRLVVRRVKFNGVKGSQDFVFDWILDQGTNMILADNLKGKSSIFKIIRYALTGDNDLAQDVRGWLRNVYVEFSLLTEGDNKTITAHLNFEGTRMSGRFYSVTIDGLIDQEIDARKLLYEAGSEKAFRDYVESFFFNEFDFYHLNWTQKSSAKDKNELVEAKASWRTYYESIYLSSRNSDKLAYGGQEELIFQMLLGLTYTHAINRLKVKLDMTSFDLAKKRDAARFTVEKSEAEARALKKNFERVEKEIERLKRKELKNIDVSDYFKERNELTNRVNGRNRQLDDLTDRRHAVVRNVSMLRESVQGRVAQIKGYKDLIRKAQKKKNDLEEYLAFGIFFSNLNVTVCPHCNTPVKKGDKKTATKTCELCTHEVDGNARVDKTIYEAKINSLQAEIIGYEKQSELLKGTIGKEGDTIDAQSKGIKDMEREISELTKLNKDDFKHLTQIDDILSKANQEVKVIDQLLTLEKAKAVLEFQLKDYENRKHNDLADQISEYEARMELLEEALQALKAHRASEDQDVLENFKTLLLEELRELGITAITEVKLSDSFKILYNQNENWVDFNQISEGEQLRVKIAFYLSIIQCDIKYQAGRHPRLLIIDSPNKEEGDSRYREGLKKLLQAVSAKYGKQLQIIVGTASRELEGAVDPTQTLVLPDGAFVF